jgi:hypothetical protein
MAKHIDWEATAAMTQGIGSVIAIIVAIALSWWQQRETRNQQHRQLVRARHERVSGTAGLIQGLYLELMEANSAVGTGAWFQYIIVRFDRLRFRRAIEAIERAPLHEVGNWRIVAACIEAREAGFLALEVLTGLQDANRRTPAELSDRDYEEIQRHFNIVNNAMAPIVRALAYDMFEAGPLSEWKEHLDLPEALIPKHMRPRSIAAGNRSLGLSAVRLGIRQPRSFSEGVWALWHWREIRRARQQAAARSSAARDAQ